MAAHSVMHERRQRRVSTDELSHLGWRHFWLLSGVLAGILAIVVLVLFMRLASV